MPEGTEGSVSAAGPSGSQYCTEYSLEPLPHNARKRV
jgi:hypothetical protein